MNTPQYLLDLFNIEFRRMQEELLERVAEKVGVPVEELIRDCLPPPIETGKIIPNKEVSLRIYKTLPKKEIKIAEERCQARIWNRGKGGQCTRGKCEGTLYCSQHQKQRKHGDITDAPDRSIFPQRAKALYKGI